MNEFKGSSKYVVSEDLLRIVNISIALQKPLLIKGEPGTGKAHHLEHQVHHQGPGRPVCL